MIYLQKGFKGPSMNSYSPEKEIKPNLMVAFRPMTRYGPEPARNAKVLAVAVDIYELGHPENRGILRDITEKGVGVAGIKAVPENGNLYCAIGKIHRRRSDCVRCEVHVGHARRLGSGSRCGISDNEDLGKISTRTFGN